MSEPRPQPAPIPESLRKQLDSFRRRLWRTKVYEAIVAGFIGLLLSFLLVYGLDRVWQTPGWARLLILLAGASLFAGFAPYWLHRWIWKHRRENQLARLIARRYPGLGDRLLGVVELQSQDEQATSMSPRLRAAAMEAVAAEARERKLDAALPPARHRKWALAALALALLSAAAFIVTPRAGANALKRWLMPLSATPRYTFTALDHPPHELAVAYGEAFDVELRLDPASERRPDRANGRFGLQPPVDTILDGDRYRFSFPGQQDPGVIVFHAGDARHEVRVTPYQRPAAESIVAEILPPAYLHHPVRSLDVATGSLTVPEGGALRVTLKTTRPLKEGRYGPTTPAAPLSGIQPKDSPQEDAGFKPVEGSLTIHGLTAETARIPAGTGLFDLPFTWTDELGLASGGNFKLRIEAARDNPPGAYLQGIERQKVILAEETVDFEVLSEDDHGVRTAGIEWQGEFTRPSDGSPAKGEMKLTDGGPEMRRLAGPVAFSPAVAGIPPQKLVIRAYAEDYLPGRGRVYSEPLVLHILTRDEHAQMLKNQFDRSITELEDLARRERNQFEENQRLERLEDEQLQSEETRSRLDNQQRAEAENTRRMDELAKRNEQLLKDAARNGQIDKETLKKMAEALKSMQELAQQDLPKVDQKLGDSQDQTNTPDKAKKDLQAAVEQQKKALEKMQEAVDKASDANQRFEAGTFVSRLKKAASEEEAIASSLIGGFERMLGLPSSDIDPADSRALEQNMHQQANTASDVRWIQEDLGHYFTRTNKEPFREVMEEMRASKIDLALEDVRGRITENHGFTATESVKEWAGRLQGWAKKLEGGLDQQGGGAGGEGGASNNEDEDFEFMLRVMRMVQQEQDIRARTRALEQIRRSYEPQPSVETP